MTRLGLGVQQSFPQLLQCLQRPRPRASQQKVHKLSGFLRVPGKTDSWKKIWRQKSHVRLPFNKQNCYKSYQDILVLRRKKIPWWSITLPTVYLLTLKKTCLWVMVLCRSKSVWRHCCYRSLFPPAGDCRPMLTCRTTGLCVASSVAGSLPLTRHLYAASGKEGRGKSGHIARGCRSESTCQIRVQI